MMMPANPCDCSQTVPCPQDMPPTMEELKERAWRCQEGCPPCGESLQIDAGNAARYEVLVSRLPGADEHEEYACPECGKGYSTHAALPPLVSLLTKRTDGKNDGYQETMF